MTRPLHAVPEQAPEEAPVYHPTTRDPREVGAPMPLHPPKQPQRPPERKPEPHESEAGVILRWLFQSTPKFTIRGKAAKPAVAVWYGD